MADTVRMTTVITKELHEKLKKLARDDGRTMMKYVERQLEAHATRATK
jgi:predicted DNA-binding protein